MLSAKKSLIIWAKPASSSKSLRTLGSVATVEQRSDLKTLFSLRRRLLEMSAQAKSALL